MANALTLEDMSLGLRKVVARAKREPAGRFHSLAHLIDVPALERAYHRQRADAAVGVDGITKEQYGQNLEANLQDLHARLQDKRYRHQPIRRVHIPKGQGKTRPIGISAFEDKLVQDAVREVVEAMYEQDFVDCSHGFRPKRSAHDAVRILQRIVDRGEVRWIFEADIVSFFDSLDRTELKKMLEVRIADGSLLRLIGKCLHVGVLDGEAFVEPELGTVQGSVLSPLLGNVYGRLFGRKGTVASRLPWVDGNPRPYSGVHRGQAHDAWSAFRGQRDLCVGRRPARGRRVGANQKGKPVSGEDET